MLYCGYAWEYGCPDQAVQGEPLPPLQEGESLPITEVELKQVISGSNAYHAYYMCCDM